ncbi:MAG: hypothetical protein LC655_09710 [Bacteroidales bacterium]|nr:hypothetical protein [Bacteroidales bacterium]
MVRSADHPELVGQLHEQLFGFLNAVGAKFPVHDPLYDAALEEAHLEKVRTVRLPRLEAQRMEFLSKDFDPGNNWWGSEVE